MTTPRFEFTDRARPIIQFGRWNPNALGDDRWGSAHWGVGHWGGGRLAVDWYEAECEIYELTVDIGRGSASDRFKPGTATIVASNMQLLSDRLYPELPTERESEPLPIPPVQPPPVLTAAASVGQGDVDEATITTIETDGYTVFDGFDKVGREWIFPHAWGDLSVSPTDSDNLTALPFKRVGEAFEPELYRDPRSWPSGTLTLLGNGAAQWPQAFTTEDYVRMSVTVDRIRFDSTGSWSPGAVLELYTMMNTADRRCRCARISYNPTANTATVDLFFMAADGTRITGITSPVVLAIGSSGSFPAARWELATYFNNSDEVYLDGVLVATFDGDHNTGDTRVGFYLHYQQGQRSGSADPPEPMRITEASGGSTAFPFTDTFERHLDARWRHGAYTQLPYTGELWPNRSAAVVTETRGSTADDAYYSGDAVQRWPSHFPGSVFAEAVVSNLTQRGRMSTGHGNTTVELITHWDTATGWRISAYVDYRGGTNQSLHYFVYLWNPDNDWALSGSIDYGAGNPFPDPATWRLEADDTGAVRLLHNGATVLEGTVPSRAGLGDRIGIYHSWRAGETGGADTAWGVARSQAARIESYRFGQANVAVYEEMGQMVRIGVHHVDLGNCWLFRGHVDGMEPIYRPETDDAVRIQCIDALGEAGRPPIRGEMGPMFAYAPDRILQILRAAGWPKELRKIHDDATLMSRPGAGKAVDGLTHVAESCGGAVYGDPATGDVVFKGRDWQGFDGQATQVDGFITNFMIDRPDFDGLVVCPTGWDLSWQRSEMTTRVILSTGPRAGPGGTVLEPATQGWRAVIAENYFGIEPYERTLLAADGDALFELGHRQLALGSPRHFPRIRAAQLDASTAPEALDLMATATFTAPTHLQCQYRRAGQFMFNHRMIVTGVRHRMTPDSWSCRLALDHAAPFNRQGSRWGHADSTDPRFGRWGRSRWGRSNY
jgi:hypothetical protein